MSQSSANGSDRLGVDARAIERELQSLWKAAGEGEDEGVIRACLLNLLVYAPDQSDWSRVDDLLIDVTATHPSRALLIAADPESPSPSLDARVTSRCTIPSGSARQVCCEQITIFAGGGHLKQVASAVAPLLVSDLPTYLWWRAVPELLNETFRRLSDLADRVVLDSSRFKDPHGDLVSLGVMIRESPTWRGFSDLNWSTLGTWRELLAGFYDSVDCRAHLDDLERVVIEYGAPVEDPNTIAPRALLLGGWLADRLGWELDTEAVSNETEAKTFNFSANRRTEMVFRPVTGSLSEPGHLKAITLNAAGGARFHVNRASAGLIETESILGRERKTGRVLPYDSPAESVLIGRELELVGKDLIFESALTMAGEMVVALVHS